MDIEDLRALLAEKCVTQKDVAVRVVEWLEKNTSGDTPLLSTVESKLSKLLNGDVEGTAFFSRARRAEALAHGFDVQADHIQAMLARVELLLDPRLPPHASAAIRQQAEACPDRVTVLPAVAGAGPADATPDKTPLGPVRVPWPREGDLIRLRDAAEKHPRALVVLGHETDCEHYVSKGRRISYVRRVPRGYELEAEPTLAPVPEPLAPVLWAGGEPHIAHPELTAWMRRARVERETAHRSGAQRSELWRTDEERILDGADERGEEAGFALAHAVPWFAAEGITVTILARAAHSSAPLFVFPSARADATRVWWCKERVFASGPQAAAFASRMVGHDVVLEPPAIRAWFEALEARNPFDPVALDDVRAEVNEIGLTLEDSLAGARKVFGDGSIEDQGPFDLASFGEDGESRARRALARLAVRSMTAVPGRWMALPMYFELAAEARLSPLPLAPNDVAHVLASLGAGRVLRIRVTQFAGKGTGPLRHTGPASSRPYSQRDGGYERTSLDGDGTHVVVEVLYDERLEGAVPPARKRREQAARADSDDD